MDDAPSLAAPSLAIRLTVDLAPEDLMSSRKPRALSFLTFSTLALGGCAEDPSANEALAPESAIEAALEPGAREAETREAQVETTEVDAPAPEAVANIPAAEAPAAWARDLPFLAGSTEPSGGWSGTDTVTGQPMSSALHAEQVPGVASSLVASLRAQGWTQPPELQQTGGNLAQILQFRRGEERLRVNLVRDPEAGTRYSLSRY
jgi:hypothetical protein